VPSFGLRLVRGQATDGHQLDDGVSSVHFRGDFTEAYINIVGDDIDEIITNANGNEVMSLVGPRQFLKKIIYLKLYLSTVPRTRQFVLQT